MNRNGNRHRNQILTASTVESLIANGHSIVIFEGRVLQLDSWLDKHPGGRLAIMHMVGRDASNEINVYHSTQTLSLMHRYRIGIITEPWVNFTPPIRGGVFRKYAEQEEALSTADLSDAATLTPGSTSSEAPSPANSDVGEDTHTGHGLLQVREGPKRRRKPSPKLDPASEVFVDKVMQGEIDDNLRDYPSLDAETQHGINLKYQALHQRVHDEAYYECRLIEYGKELVRYVFLFALFYGTLRSGWYWLSACFLGLFWHQIMFTAHDAGHRGITHSLFMDSLIGMFIADFCCGLSIGWWKSSHNVHHLITNHPEHDPDIQNVPLFATCPSFLKSIHSTYYDFTYAWDAVADIAVQYQRYTYYPVMGVARFNLYILSIHHLLTSHRSHSRLTSWMRPTEIAFMACYWFLFGYCLVWCTLPDWTTRIGFVLISHIITMPLHVQITLSHWGMPTADLGDAESFPQRQLRTTMDVDCPAWLDFIHGGLQFQAVHHLFPQVPRHNLRRLQVLVREFCDEVGIKYSILGFVDGNKEVLGRLGEVAAQVNIMLKCQQHMAATGDSGLH